MDLIVGTKDGVVLAACMAFPNSSLDKDIIDMLKGGMIVQVINAKSVTIGAKLCDVKYEESFLPDYILR